MWLSARQPAYSARYYPSDTMVYAWITLAPGGGQLEHSKDILDRLEESRNLRRLKDDWTDEFERETNIDIEEDIFPWVGPDLSVGLIDYDYRRDLPLIAATVGVRDHRAARDFLDDWLDYLESQANADFDRDDYKDFETWTDSNNAQAYALSDHLLVFASTEDLLQELIDGITGEVEVTLADSDHFRMSRESLTEQRFLSIFVDYPETAKLATNLWHDELGDMGLSMDVPEWIGGSATWMERALLAETVSPIGWDHPLRFPNLQPPDHLLLSDTVAFVSGSFDPNVDNWRRALNSYDVLDLLSPQEIEEMNGGIRDMEQDLALLPQRILHPLSPGDDLIDISLGLIEEATGIDLETGLLDPLTGQFTLAMRDVDFAAVADHSDENPVEVVLFLPYRPGRHDKLVKTMDDVVDLVAEHGVLRPRSTDVGADSDAQIYHTGTAYTPGFVLHGGNLVGTTTKGLLVETINLSTGTGDSLESEFDYQRAIGFLPEQLQWMFYADVRRLSQQIDHEDSGLTTDEWESLQTSLGVLAFAAYFPHCEGPSMEPFFCRLGPKDDYSRATAVLTFFPEQQ